MQLLTAAAETGDSVASPHFNIPFTSCFAEKKLYFHLVFHYCFAVKSAVIISDRVYEEVAR